MDRQGRFNLVLLTMALGFLAVVFRLTYLQIIQAPDLAAQAERQQQRTVKLEAKRGTIYDRKGRELAISLEVESLYGVPSATEDPRETAKRLSRVLHSDPRKLEHKLDTEKSFVWLSRKVEPARAARVRELELKEVGFTFESRRFYPKKSLAGSVLGFTGIDNQGLEGIERAYDGELRGESGWVIAEKDAKGRTVFPRGNGLGFRLPTPGNDLILTLDEVIQHIADKELEQAVLQAKARGGVLIVLDPKTGELLALSVRGGAGGTGFNPNEPQRYSASEWRNQSVTDAFEPGSIFKVVLTAAALEEKVVHPLERFDCSAGSIKVGDRVINDAHPSGVLTFTDVIAVSSNVGTIKVALKLGKQRLAKYIDAFGFGKKTGIDLPGEISGLVKDHRTWSGVSIGSISIGQEIGVTPIQVAAAYGALANDGILMKPHGVLEIRGPVSGESRKFEPEQAGTPVSKDTAHKVKKILQRVVEAGTGRQAKPSGYTAAGKTGTAQKIDGKTGTYSKKDYVSSFVGFAPAGVPRLVILVMIDTPEGAIYGGAVAAPVFRAVAEQSLAYLQVPPDDAGESMLLVNR